MTTELADDHLCEFLETEILQRDADAVLKVGMKVLIPCSCGATPLDHLDFTEARNKELNDALLAVEPYRALYHWAPASRRKSIVRYGLKPGMDRTTTSGGRSNCVCFADSPSWAWALSGQMSYTEAGKWDLWQTWQDRLTDPVVLSTSERPSGLYEVRTEHRLYKRHLWYVGSRTKEA